MPFSGQKFMEKDGKPYCVQDWHKLFGNTCAKCTRPIQGQVIKVSCIHSQSCLMALLRCYLVSNVSRGSFSRSQALGKTFHVNHFTCHGCDCALTSAKVFEFEQKVLCQKCFSRLPVAVRKRLEKQRRAKKAAEAKRQEAAKAQQ